MYGILKIEWEQLLVVERFWANGKHKTHRHRTSHSNSKCALRQTGNFYYVMGDDYDLVNTAKTVFNIQISSEWRAEEARRVMAAH